MKYSDINKAISISLLVFVFMFMPTSSEAAQECEEAKQAEEDLTEVRKTPGKNDGVKPEVVEKAEKSVRKSIDKGCLPPLITSGLKRKDVPVAGNIIRPAQVPAAPGQEAIDPKALFFGLDLSDLGIPFFEFPKAPGDLGFGGSGGSGTNANGGNNGGGNDGNGNNGNGNNGNGDNGNNGNNGGGGDTPGTIEPKDCGGTAVDFVEFVLALEDDKPTYKDDCAGYDTDGTPRSSPNKPATVCEDRQFGSFGIIYSAYNNTQQNINITALAARNPAATEADSGNAILYKNSFGSNPREPDGCRLTNLSACGEDGDIVFLQTGQNSGKTTPYNHWMIYSKTEDSFYEVINDSANPVKKGSLPAGYGAMNYEVHRLDCSQ